jgi:hypothetical protein
MMPTKLREIPAGPHNTQGQTETDLAMMSIWLMICVINAVILFDLY